ncbi:hypothetical protein Save01_09046 [Streptomyces avermitilis]|uniref:Uncharacterized protein n=3 Tax=Streptomyces TaxID=1883 RepID=Q82RA4_STRAW|nr:hypothetical protein SAVERM_239 [Streptomyces avermitilis MA-4680 = NBRC 14893]BBJ47654.1 hypothetical protein SAVMC3_02830 [Streptomyces avermitilis]GDY69967.1 hypothetical protein SAV14893_093600 [Streptomyces avermitilis]GDY80232.1 hypothetical protein SAV31267_097170 [Streptomyces avermitilis]
MQGHRSNYVRPHCYCAACMGLGLRIGAFGPAVDEEGNTVPGSRAVYPWSALPAVIGGDVDRDERPFAWFTHFLEAAGPVVVDEGDGENLWPRGIQHDDALFCETGVTGEFGLADGVAATQFQPGAGRTALHLGRHPVEQLLPSWDHRVLRFPGQIGAVEVEDVVVLKDHFCCSSVPSHTLPGDGHAQEVRTGDRA